MFSLKYSVDFVRIVVVGGGVGHGYEGAVRGAYVNGIRR